MVDPVDAVVSLVQLILWIAELIFRGVVAAARLILSPFKRNSN